jgi:trypsin
MTARRLVCIVVLVVAASVAGGRGAGGVVGGRPLSVRDAPWTAVLRLNWSLKEHCTGVIVGASTVLTAAHCLYGAWGLRTPATLTVTAGVSNYLDPQPGDAPETRTVASYRVHPGYGHRYEPDDIAVLRLDRPFRLGADVRAVPLAPAGAAYPSGAATAIVGFGQQHQSVATPTGALVAAPASILQQGVCGAPRWFLLPLNGILLCASAPAGAACFGDSGSPLVIGGRRPVLVGVLSQLRGAGCVRGVGAVYTYVGAPEIRRFIEGDEHPPMSPRLSAASIELHYPDPLRVGDLVSCHVDWLRAARRIRYTFATFGGRVLQSGSDRTYTVASGAAGHELVCIVAASNGGGTTLASRFLTVVARN